MLFEAVEHGPITWSGEWQGNQYEDRGEILEFQAERRLVYTHYSPLSGEPDRPENYHTVAIDLASGGMGTTVTLAQGNNQTTHVPICDNSGAKHVLLDTIGVDEGIPDLTGRRVDADTRARYESMHRSYLRSLSGVDLPTMTTRANVPSRVGSPCGCQGRTLRTTHDAHSRTATQPRRHREMVMTAPSPLAQAGGNEVGAPGSQHRMCPTVTPTKE